MIQFPYEELFTATDYFHLFPSPENVFARQVDEHAKYLLPIASVSLEHLNPEWEGLIHFVLPIEPEDYVVGGESQKYHNYSCRTNWVGYRMTDNKYELATDFRFFKKAALEDDPTIQFEYTDPEYLNEHYQNAFKEYLEAKDELEEHGALFPEWAKKNGMKNDEDRIILASIGGFAGWGNWPSMSDIPVVARECIDQFGEEDRAAVPQTHDMRDFYFIGELAAWNYVSKIGCRLLLFYDPVEQIALNTFDWS